MDQRQVAQFFIGRTVEAIAAELEKDPYSALGKFWDCGPKALIYYFPAVLTWLSKSAADVDAQDVERLISIIIIRRKEVCTSSFMDLVGQVVRSLKRKVYLEENTDNNIKTQILNLEDDFKKWKADCSVDRSHNFES